MKGITILLVVLMIFATQTLSFAQDYIEGPWLWMIAPGSHIDSDQLSKVSGGDITEENVATQGVNEGDAVGALQWTRGRIDPTTSECKTRTVLGFLVTTCASDNINDLVNDIGLSSNPELDHYAAYALIDIISPRDQTGVEMGVGSDDTVKVWLNGEVVHKNNVERRTEGIQDKFTTNLKAGSNLLLVKVCDFNFHWGMFFSIYLNDTEFQTAIPGKSRPDPPVPIPSTDTRVSLSASPAHSPGVGQQVTVSVNITNGVKVSGYQATVSYDTTALRYVKSANGDYLPQGAFFIPAVAEGNKLRLAGTSLAGESNGAGTLATITFEVVAVKTSTLSLSDVLLTDGTGKGSTPETVGTEITEDAQPAGNPADVNKDNVVNILDLTLVASNFGKTGNLAADVNGDNIVNILDLTLVAAAFGDAAAAPTARHLDRAVLEGWLREARGLNLADPASHRGISVLEQLLATLTPKETILLPNYPNPFNPETWIPYQLSAPADVTISIYAADGKLVRTLALGHQPVGLYKSRNRAAYWDGKNALGEPVASGVYFYTLTAGEFTATRKMLIRK